MGDKIEMMNKIRDKYTSLYDIDGVSKECLDELERELGIKLPDDFREIASYGCGALGGWGTHSFSSSDPTNLLGETLRIRSAVGLPNRFIVLGEPSESIIVMDTENKPSILWIDSVEIDGLEKRDFVNEPDIWENFSDFFSELLEDEEEERNY